MALGLLLIPLNHTTNTPEYEVVVSNPIEGELFIGNSAIARAIEHSSIKVGETIGKIRFKIGGFNAEYDWHYPFGERGSRAHEHFTRMDLSKQIDLLILPQIKKHYPKVKFVTLKNPSEDRLRQQRRAGLSEEEVKRSSIVASIRRLKQRLTEKGKIIKPIKRRRL